MYFIKKSSYNGSCTTLLYKKSSRYWFIDDLDDSDYMTDPDECYPLTFELLLKYIKFKEEVCRIRLEDFKPNRKKLIKDIILWLIHQE